ncbi:phosphatidylserine decarboxylase-domain-containing protein [Mycotypha africana]|uniref:phosphatidylserine decarboxylase-domain-containing protein n=1 Tax=Mycotypha africana TaxID=64632 RepID=UPI0023015B0C|nr:phosphatidylserine decarboxylase-domain-containing protein [Mycotypha africana]KAI8988405.1 phosphatidylserine decarboxylase-domain-containing protein [Mycotypha africana]
MPPNQPESYKSSSNNSVKEDLYSAELVLKVNVIQARNLIRDDETNALSPYANVCCGGIRHRTDTLKKSSNPEWNCIFEFNLSNDILGHKRRLRALKKQGLSITVYSKDRFSSIFLGQINLSLDQLFKQNESMTFEKSHPKWLPLSLPSRQHRRLHLRRKKLDDSAPTTTAVAPESLSDSEQTEIQIQYGLLLKTSHGDIIPYDDAILRDDWQSLLADDSTSNIKDEELSGETEAESGIGGSVDEETLSSSVPAPMPALHGSSSTTSFSSRFRRPLRHNHSTSSTTSSSSIAFNTAPSTPAIHQTETLPSGDTTGDKKKGRKLRRKFKRKQKNRKASKGGYAKFYSDIMGVTFLEIESAKDLPPERNMTRTGFDMDPFVIISYGTSTFRTRAIRHSLNPVWNEKLFFHVRNTEENYKIKFAIYDKDKFSNNDFVASQEITIADIIQKMPTSPSSAVDALAHATPSLSTSEHQDSEKQDKREEDCLTASSNEIERNMGRHTIPLNLAKPEKWKDSCHPMLTFRAKFVPYVEMRRMFWMALAKACDADNSNTMNRLEVQTMLEALGSNISEHTLDKFWKQHDKDPSEDLTLDELVESLEAFILASDKTEEDPNVIIEQSKDVPISADKYTTANPFFMAATSDDEEEREGYEHSDEEDEDDDYEDGQMMDDDEYIDDEEEDEDEDDESEYDYFTSHNEYDDDYMDSARSGSSSAATASSVSPDESNYEALAEGEGIQYVDTALKQLQLKDVDGSTATTNKHHHEKVIRLNECPICHKPNLAKRGQMDIITHVATCAANDWTTVDRFLISNFGSEAQAQRKWFVKLVNQVGYGRYSIGKNNANIIVQDRLTGQLIDERMSVYIRLGMRLLYKGMKSSIQSRAAKRLLANMSYKQGRRFDSPLSQREIRPFIKFHQLDMSEVLEPIENFKTFNEFFYRKLKPGSRPCDAPDNQRVAVSPADCRMMAFPSVDAATTLWIKGLEFSLSKLLDDAQEAKYFEGGSLAIFRLAPQDYHRFHSPVDGTIRKIHNVEGQYFTVNPMAIRTTLDVYGENKRDIVYMETEEFGQVAVVCIGAMMVGSIILTAGVGDYLKRTDELGYFAFGGSTLVVLFQKHALRFDEDLLENANNSLETLVRVGNHIGVHP